MKPSMSLLESGTGSEQVLNPPRLRIRNQDLFLTPSDFGTETSVTAKTRIVSTGDESDK